VVAHVEGGFSDGGHAWANPNLTADYTRAKSANARWIRTDWDWWASQETNGPIDWSRLDSVVNLCDSLGLKVLPILHFVPPWANGGAGDYGPPSPIVSGLRQAATELGTPIQIMFAGLSPTTANPSSANVSNFLNAAYTAGAQPLFDIMGFHPYCGLNSPLTAAPMNSEIITIRNLLDSKGDTGKKIWATEFGWGTTPSGDAQAATEAQLAQMALDAATRWSSYSYTGPLFWYSIRDRQTYAANTGDREDYFGAWRNDGTPKTGVNTNIAQVFATSTPPMTIWNGSAETTVTANRWNGSAEAPVTVEVAP
jgi:hypothetical protein